MNKNMYGMAVAIVMGIAYSAPNVPSSGIEQMESGYRIDTPGTITFTVGIKIKGKVDKPQVVIVLPKEKPWYRSVEFGRSFIADIMEPLPFDQKNE